MEDYRRSDAPFKDKDIPTPRIKVTDPDRDG
jgi:hypothetical protein